MRVVVAVGGNALLPRGQPLEAQVQRRHARLAARAIAAVAAEHEVVLTHGNGPQVGLIALQNEAYDAVAPYPLDVLGAQSEGMVGYVLQQELANALPGRDVVTVVTQTLVERDDPAFRAPTKPIGPQYPRDEADRLAAERGWVLRPDGEGYRRVVPSPAPHAIVEERAIRTLVDAGVLVICAGGGGIPVTRDGDGELAGAEAVVDKDLASALLADRLDCAGLLLLTDVDGVYRDWGTPAARRLEHTDPATLRALGLAAGSMGPKVEAACRFAESGGGYAAIARLDDALAAAQGRAGTRVVAGRRSTRRPRRP